jgi:hypothetical protein
MPVFSPFHPGTVTFTNGSAAIAGTGTDFRDYAAGDTIEIPGLGSMQLADDPVSATAATGLTAWQGATQSNKAYDWKPLNPGSALATRVRTYLELVANGNLESIAALSTVSPTALLLLEAANKQEMRRLLGGLVSNERVAVVGDLTIDATHEGKTLALEGGDFDTITFPTAGTLVTGFPLKLVNREPATGRGKKIVVPGYGTFVLYPSQSAYVYEQDGDWCVDRLNRWKITTPVNFYVDGATGDDANDGLDEDAPFETAQGMFDTLLRNTEFGIASTVHVWFADGTYGTIHGAGKMSGAEGGGHLHLHGNALDRDAVVFSGATSALEFYLDCTVQLHDLKVEALVAGAGLVIGMGGRCYIDDVEFGDCVAPMITITDPGSWVKTINGGTAWINGDSQGFISVNGACEIDISVVAPQLMQDVTFSTATIIAQNIGLVRYKPIVMNGHTITVSGAGYRYYRLGGARITGTTGGDLNTIPGSADGLDYEKIAVSGNGLTVTNTFGTAGAPTIAIDTTVNAHNTIAIAGTTAAGAGTYSTRTMNYFRFGNLIIGWIRLTWSAHTGTGNMKITGLPVAAAETTPVSLWFTSITYSNNEITGRVSGTEILLYDIASAGSAALAMDTAADLSVMVIYRV